MIVYFDSSMLVKKYVDEELSSEAHALWRQANRHSCSVIGYGEVMSALHRRLREGTISREGLGNLAQQVQEDWVSVVHVALSWEVNLVIARLLASHALRAMDAIHLASVLSLRDQMGHDVPFACADLRLAAAAQQEGLKVLPEQIIIEDRE